MPDLLESRDGAVLRLTLHREAQRNALSPGMVEGLHAALDAAAADPAVRVVVLTGAGDRAFCSGGDLGSGSGDGFLATHDARRRYGALLDKMAGFDKPIVARINGYALAGGLGLVLACDLAVAVEGAKFGTPEVDVGLFPYMVTAFLFRQIPDKWAMELVLTGEKVLAPRAQEMGLLNRVVAAADLDAAVEKYTQSLAGKSPAVLRLGKRAMRQTRDLALTPALELLSAQLSVNTLAEDAMEGVSAFLEKRDPSWTGR